MPGLSRQARRAAAREVDKAIKDTDGLLKRGLGQLKLRPPTDIPTDLIAGASLPLPVAGDEWQWNHPIFENLKTNTVPDAKARRERYALVLYTHIVYKKRYTGLGKQLDLHTKEGRELCEQLWGSHVKILTCIASALNREADIDTATKLIKFFDDLYLGYHGAEPEEERLQSQPDQHHQTSPEQSDFQGEPQQAPSSETPKSLNQEQYSIVRLRQKEQWFQEQLELKEKVVEAIKNRPRERPEPRHGVEGVQSTIRYLQESNCWHQAQLDLKWEVAKEIQRLPREDSEQSHINHEETPLNNIDMGKNKGKLSKEEKGLKKLLKEADTMASAYDGK